VIATRIRVVRSLYPRERPELVEHCESAPAKVVLRGGKVIELTGTSQ